MPQLLHEHWENYDGGWFGPVRKETDDKRPLIMPNAKFGFDLWASSWEEAAQKRNDKLGWGPYVPADGVPNCIYSEEDKVTQAAYILVRRTTNS